MTEPKITISSLIFKSKIMADWMYQSLFEFTPQLHTGEAEFFFVANDPTDEIVSHLQKNGYRYFINHNPRLSNVELFRRGFGPPEYIHRVYRGYNYAIAASKGEIIVLVNSDHYFSPSWLDNLLKHVSDRTFVVSQLVEPRYPCFPGAYHQKFGHPVSGFDKTAFLSYAQSVSKPDIRIGGGFMPCAFLKSLAERVQYYPEGNIAGKTFHPHDIPWHGDQYFVKKLNDIGVKHITALDSIVYHLNEGEKNSNG